MQHTNTNHANTSSHDLDLLVSDLQTVLSSALKQRIGGLFQEYALYKETHDAVMHIPAVIQSARTMIRDTVPESSDSVSSESNFKDIIRRLTSENDHLKTQLATALSVSDNTHHGANIRLIVEEKSANEPLSAQVHATSITSTATAAAAACASAVSLDLTEFGNGNSIVPIYDTIVSVVADEEESVEEVAEEEEEEVAEEEEEEVAEEEEEEVAEEEEEEVAEEEEEVAEEEEEEEEEGEEVAEEEEEEVAEEEEEEEEEVAEEEEEEEEEVAEEEEEVAEEEEEVEVIEITIKGKSYFTTNETDGIIYECTRDGDIGKEVGKFEGGRPKFNKK